MSDADSFSITIVNQSNITHQFCLFQAMPKPKGGPDEVFANVYQSSIDIPSGPNSKVTFTMWNKYYAIFGTSTASPNGMVKVETSDSKDAVIARKGKEGVVYGLGTVKDEGRAPQWLSENDNKTSQSGSFGIAADTSFVYPSPYGMYIGCAAQDPEGNIIPIQTYMAEPGATSLMFPKVKYYICYGTWEPGTIVDRKTIGQCLQVDFTYATDTRAKFTLNNHGRYDPDDNVEKFKIDWSFGPVPTD